MIPSSLARIGPPTAIIIYLDKDRDVYGRCHNGYHDDYQFLMEGAPGQLLLDKFVTKQNQPLPLPAIMFEEVDSPFSP